MRSDDGASLLRIALKEVWLGRAFARRIGRARTLMNENRSVVAATCLLLACCALAYAQAAHSQPSPGIVLLAHGGRVSTWNDEVQRIATEVNKTYPTELAFGMATKSSIQYAVDKLLRRGVQRIIAVPLFISSYSSVIASTEWLFGLRPDMPEDYKVFAKMSHNSGGHEGHHGAASPDTPLIPLDVSVPVRMTPALNRHPIVAAILADRAAAISTNPQQEVVILVAHGPNSGENNVKWLADLQVLATMVQSKAPYHRVEYLTIRDDAEEPVVSQAKAEFRSLVEKANSSGKRALVVPVLLSYGGVENRIRERVNGLKFTMATQGLLPDSRIVDWVLASAGAAAE